MAAAEYKLPDRSSGFSWLALAQGVYNNQKDNPSGWDPSKCGGGIRWQKQPFQSGYELRNSISNAGFFQLAARLAVYTGDDSYTDWAVKSWDWSETHGLVNNKTWKVNDSTDGSNGCTTQDHTDWTYNYGAFLNGCAYMYDFVSYSLLVFPNRLLTPIIDQRRNLAHQTEWADYEDLRHFLHPKDQLCCLGPGLRSLKYVRSKRHALQGSVSDVARERRPASPLNLRHHFA